MLKNVVKNCFFFTVQIRDFKVYIKSNASQNRFNFTFQIFKKQLSFQSVFFTYELKEVFYTPFFIINN